MPDSDNKPIKRKRKGRGFASLSKAERQRVAALGGKAVQEQKKGFRFDSESGTRAAKKRFKKKDK